jgi:hypothetical protein
MKMVSVSSCPESHSSIKLIQLLRDSCVGVFNLALISNTKLSSLAGRIACSEHRIQETLSALERQETLCSDTKCG